MMYLAAIISFSSSVPQWPGFQGAARLFHHNRRPLERTNECSPGQSKPCSMHWSYHLGQKQMDATALAHYFAPLRWLTNKIKNKLSRGLVVSGIACAGARFNRRARVCPASTGSNLLIRPPPMPVGGFWLREVWGRRFADVMSLAICSSVRPRQSSRRAGVFEKAHLDLLGCEIPAIIKNTRFDAEA